MIVDGHVHVFFEGSDPEEFFTGCARLAAVIFNKESRETQDPQELLQTFMPVLGDPTADKLIGYMDEAGIDRAVLLPLDFFLGCDEPAVGEKKTITIEEKNRLFTSFVAKHKGRLFSYFGIDPRRKGALELFRKGVEEWGMIGLKLHPTTGFYPHDPVCYPFYQAAQEMGVPVLIHSGTEPAPLKPMYSQPCFIDTVAADFPELKIIIAHCGHGWWEEAIDMATSKPNLYVDFSGWQSQYSGHPDYYYRSLRVALDMLGPWRVIFGTDGSMTNFMVWPKDWVAANREPNSPSGIKFSQEEMEIVLGGAAARLYGWE
ncbi:MAG: amidohydrolase family protein [Actinomycetota bacterium]|nr:amidohydrolase family protein [Actinomycetota bacterium]MDD5667728.1 amidohydrolase family protein [Actinomycetota bacterium]